MITRFKAKNFKHLVDVDLEFDDINLISGEPGQGKTAVIEGINLHYTNKLDDVISEYVRWGEKKFEIEITEFFSGKKIWHKIIGSKGLKHELVIDDDRKNIFFDSSAVQELASMFDVDIIENSNISMQHESTAILKQKRTPRLRTMKKIFKVDAVDNVVADMKEQKKKFDIDKNISYEKIQVLKGQEFDYDELPELPEIDINKFEEKFVQLEKDKLVYEEEQKKYSLYKQQLEQYEEAQSIIDEYKKKILSFKKDISELEKYLMDEVVYNEELHDSLISDKKVMILKKDDIEKQIKNYNDADDQVKDLVQKINFNKSEIDNLKFENYDDEKLESDNKKYVAFEDELKSKIISLINVENEIKLYELGECPITKKECDVASAIDIENVKEEKKKLVLSKVEIEDKMVDINLNMKEYEKNKNKQDQLNTELKLFDEQKSKWQKKIDEYISYDKDVKLLSSFDKNQEDLENQIKDNDSIKGKYEKVKIYNDKILNMKVGLEKDYESYTIRIEEKEDIKQPEPFIFSIRFSQSIYDDIKNKIQTYTDIQKEISIIAKSNEKITKQKKDNQLKIEKLEQEFYELEKKIKIIYDSYNLLDKGFCSYLVDSGVQRIKDNMNDFFGRSYGRYSVEFKHDSNGVDFFYSENENDWHSVNMLSGFEKQVFAMSWRYALIPEHDLNLMIFDEIESDGPPESSIILYDTILKESKSDSQIIAITHKAETKDFLLNERNCNVIEIFEGIQI